MSKPVILVASRSFWEAREVVQKEILHDEFELVFALDLNTPPQVGPNIVAIVAADQHVGGEQMGWFPNLRTVARTGTGCDNIDLAEAERRGICVTRVSVLNAESVSEFAIAQLFALSRHLVPIHANMLQMRWERRSGMLFKEMTFGLVGLGAVGRAIAKKLHAFGVPRILGWNRTFRLEVSQLIDDCGLEMAEMPRLFRESDAVVVALALTPETRGLINRDMFSLMKPTALFVNIGRGAVVDEDALASMALEDRIGGVALDVYSVEPPEPVFNEPFMRHFIIAAEAGRNIILTPHNAATTKNSSQNVALQVGRNVLKVLRGETEGLEIVKTDH